jgi:hypothetical protein
MSSGSRVAEDVQQSSSSPAPPGKAWKSKRAQLKSKLTATLQSLTSAASTQTQFGVDKSQEEMEQTQGGSWSKIPPLALDTSVSDKRDTSMLDIVAEQLTCIIIPFV